VTQDDAGASRQSLQSNPQPFALPLVRHQPKAGQRLATAHARLYSAAVVGTSPAERLASVRDGIARAARLARRSPDEVSLIAVSKTQPAHEILPLLEAGHRTFGENRVQEAQSKWPGLRENFPDVQLHLIGQLQSNKAEEAVQLFDCIHSLDRPSLATALGRAIEKLGRRPDCFIQVNIGDEPQKGGCATGDLAGFVQTCRTAGLPIVGLMCIPPAEVEPAPYFALLAKLAHRHGLPSLSMGMSADHETAVMIGATHVRVGTSLFGERS
jgi:pyridoxal phosphate enzyme (YggS family)